MQVETTTSPSVPPSFQGAGSFVAKLKTFAADIKISHTLFAMPFALLSTVLAWRNMREDQHLGGKILLIVFCMITARTVAMASNRLLDAKLDAKNPRTARRALPSGALSWNFVVAIVGICVALFLGAAAMFYFLYANYWPIVLAIPVLVFLGAYPLLKRFTQFCHYYLGAALALAPICAWVAVTGTIDLPPVIMAGAVLLWTAGFDIIYACQDYKSDLDTGTFSIPAKLGISRALWVSRGTHLVSASLLIALGFSTPYLSTLFFIGVGLCWVLLIVEHSIVRADNLSKVNLAFFTINGIISVALGTLGILDVVRH